jgi:hypothetical protein
MRYLLLICSDDKTLPPPPKAQMEAIVEGHGRFAGELHAAGKMVAGERLRPEGEATRVRFKAGHRQVTDGPFTETKEALGGFYLLAAADLDEAIALASQLPEVHADHSGVEIRPVVGHG